MSILPGVRGVRSVKEVNIPFSLSNGLIVSENSPRMRPAFQRSELSGPH